ncbi:hypothetical protein ACU686_06570 [Yinghuangia aomiensis]
MTGAGPRGAASSDGRRARADLYRPGDTPLHRLPPRCKLVAVVLFVFAVVATPRERFWAFGVYALLLAAVAVVGRVPAGYVLRRVVVEVPFVVFAVALPFLAGGEKTEFLGLTVSHHGLLVRPIWRRARWASSRRFCWRRPRNCGTCCSAWSGCGCRNCWCRSCSSCSGTRV